MRGGMDAERVDEQIIAILKENTARAKTTDLIQQCGVSRETFYK